MKSTNDNEEKTEKMIFMPLGGGQEVGRSCMYLNYKGRTVLLDCGIHPGLEGFSSCPYFDLIDPEDIDVVLVTHFHLDHCAGLPYFTEKTNFKGKIFMTHATKAVMRLLVADSVKLTKGGLYDDNDLHNCMSKIEVLDFHQTLEHKGIKFCAYAAGHVLGAAMFTIDIDGVVVLYTGDYSMEEDRHLLPAEIPHEKPDLLIVESTYGVQAHSSREERESRFKNTVEETVSRGGNCLIPVFALGRAQELLLILDEYWQAQPHLHHIPIYYASRLATKALRVYQTFVNMMNTHIRQLSNISNPFRFNHIQNFQTEFDPQGQGPCVVIASPGMLQSGTSRQLFDLWCDNQKNAVVLAGYSVEGTLAKKLLQEPEEIVCLDGRKKPRRCTIEYVSFSAHVDYIQNLKFIKTIRPDNIILVHGEQTEMKRLKEELDREISGNWVTSHKPVVVMPKNSQRVRLTFTKPLEAELCGLLSEHLIEQLDSRRNPSGAAEELDDEGEEGEDGLLTRAVDLPESTILVSENFVNKVVDMGDLSTYTPCRLGRIRQRLHVPIPAGLGFTAGEGVGLEVLVPYLAEVFDALDFYTDTAPIPPSRNEDHKNASRLGQEPLKIREIIVQGLVSLRESSDTKISGASNGSLLVEWMASPIADMIADSVTCMAQQGLSATAIVLARMIPIKTDLKAFITSRIRSKSSIDISLQNRVDTRSNNQDTEDLPLEKKMKLAWDPLLNTSYEKELTVNSIQSTETLQAKRNRVSRLRKLRDDLLLQNKFSEILLNADGTSLIFRDLNKGIEGLAEIHFHSPMDNKDGGVKYENEHSAVIKCEDDSFRGLIVSTLKNIDDRIA